MKQVLIKPLWGNGLDNRLFETIYGYTLTLWRDSSAKIGIALDSWDMMPLHKADCILFQDLPDTKDELYNARKKAKSGTPFILQVMESPLCGADNFDQSNRNLFDYVITYEQNISNKNGYYSYRLPHSLVYDCVHEPYEGRRCLVMVNRNCAQGYFAPRQKGLVGLPGIGQNFSGWNIPLKNRIFPAYGELYTWRRKLARLAEQMDLELMDIVGYGWNAERISWSKLYPNRPYKNLKFSHIPNKLEFVKNYRFCISVENYRGTHDYISEKIFDPLIAGSVPVYLGDENICNLISDKAFVDVRHFRSQRDLLLYLKSCKKSEWETMYYSGQDFLKTKMAHEFKSENFVKTMNDSLSEILGISNDKQ